MDFDKLMISEKDTVLGYVVFNNHTLGYLFRWFGTLGLGVLGSKVIKGGINWKNGPRFINSKDFKHIREATKKDFDYFNVSSTGHI